MIRNDTPVYLRPNVLVEPLNNQWYVNLPMIAPHTNAMIVKNSHIKILESYIMSPDLHAAAVADPKMRGGPFAAIDKSRLDEVKGLLDRTLVEHKQLLEFAEAVMSMDRLLRTEAKGYSLEPLYEKVPDPLKGYVELVYDLNNNPALRFLEGLLYKSPYYDVEQQSVFLSLVSSDDRPSVLSTPRLKNSSSVEIRKPFASTEYDEFFRLKHEPRAFGEISDLLGISSEDSSVFSSLMTTESPANSEDQKYVGEGVRVRYFGHACLLVEDKNVSILMDPLISYDYPGSEKRYSFSDLPNVIDYIVISHGHLDHIVLETLLQLRHKTRNIVVPKTSKGFLAEPSLKLLLKNLGFQCNVIELDEMEEVKLPEGTLTAIPFLGEHHDLNISGKAAYRIQFNDRSFLIAADSANLEPRLYDLIRDIYGPVDTLFLGMECDGAPLSWFYGPLLTQPIDRDMAYSRKGSGSDEFRATKLLDSLECKQAFVYAMGLEHWFGHILSLNYNDESKQIVESNRFVAKCKDKGIESERLYATAEFFFD